MRTNPPERNLDETRSCIPFDEGHRIAESVKSLHPAKFAAPLALRFQDQSKRCLARNRTGIMIDITLSEILRIVLATANLLSTNAPGLVHQGLSVFTRIAIEPTDAAAPQPPVRSPCILAAMLSPDGDCIESVTV